MYADASRDWRGIYRAVGDELLTGVWDPAAAPPNTEPLYDPDPSYARVEAAVLHPIRTSRATVAVRDLPRAVAFYTEVVGLRLLARGPDGRYAVLGGTLGGPDVALITADADISPGLHHFGLQVARDELTEATDRLAAHGVPVLLTTSTAAKRSIVIADPDGIRLEFFVPRDRPVADDPGGAAGSGAAPLVADRPWLEDAVHRL